MNLTTVEGTTVTSFSQSTLDLQKDFCCTDKDTRKVIRWVGCKPGVYQSSMNLFSSSDLALCSWYQEVGTYNFITTLLNPGQVGQINLNSKYILVKASWPSNALESAKNIEIGIGQQAGYIGMSIPFLIGSQTEISYRYMIFKDLFHINCESPFTSPIQLNNISPYSVSVSILYAN
jgi:hypothetical protein